MKLYIKRTLIKKAGAKRYDGLLITDEGRQYYYNKTFFELRKIAKEKGIELELTKVFI